MCETEKTTGKLTGGCQVGQCQSGSGGRVQATGRAGSFRRCGHMSVQPNRLDHKNNGIGSSEDSCCTKPPANVEQAGRCRRRCRGAKSARRRALPARPAPHPPTSPQLWEAAYPFPLASMPPRTTLEVAEGVGVVTLHNPPVNALHPAGGLCDSLGSGRSPPTRLPTQPTQPLSPAARSAARPVQPSAGGACKAGCEGDRHHGRRR